MGNAGLSHQPYLSHVRPCRHQESRVSTTDFVLRVEGLGRKVDSFTEEQVDLNIL